MVSPALPGEVLVAWAALDVGDAQVAAASRLLSADEMARAARLVFPLHRARWIASRALLRRLLGEQTGQQAQDVRFEYAPGGKPMLAQVRGPRFNLSHSEGYAACAITAGSEVGIDLEVVRPLADLEAVAAQFFSPAERDDLRSLPQEGRLRGFWECWTRKEAFLKATGDGMGRPLDTFSVTLRPGERPRLLETTAGAGEGGRWTLLAVEPRPGLLAAIALPRAEWRVRCVDVSRIHT